MVRRRWRRSPHVFPVASVGSLALSPCHDRAMGSQRTPESGTENLYMVIVFPSTSLPPIAWKFSHLISQNFPGTENRRFFIGRLSRFFPKRVRQFAPLNQLCSFRIILDYLNNTDDATKDPDILQHLSEAHLQNPMAREDPKWRSVGASGTWTSGQADTGAGSDTPSGSQHPAPHAKPWPGTRRGRGREAGLATVGGETLKQSWNSRGPTGPEWQEQPRTECDGGGSLMAYAPLGATGISKKVSRLPNNWRGKTFTETSSWGWQRMRFTNVTYWKKDFLQAFSSSCFGRCSLNGRTPFLLHLSREGSRWLFN